MQCLRVFDNVFWGTFLCLCVCSSEPPNPTGLIMEPTLLEGGGEYLLLVIPGSNENVSNANLRKVTFVMVETELGDTEYLWRVSAAMQLHYS